MSYKNLKNGIIVSHYPGIPGNKPIEKLKSFHYYLCTDENKMFKQIETQPRIYVGTLMAKDLNDAFVRGQNENPEYKAFNNRSVSVGDMILEDNNFYMVCGIGYKLVFTLNEE